MLGVRGVVSAHPEPAESLVPLNLVPLKHVARVNVATLDDMTDPDYAFDYVDISSVTPELGIARRERVTFGTAPSRARRKVAHGDTIVSTVRTYLRAVAFVDEPDDLVVSTGFAVLSPCPGVDPRYLYRAVQSKPFVDEVVARSTGVSYPAINPSDLGRIGVCLPDVGAQLAIADFLDRETAKIDALVAKKQRLIELLQEERTAVISHTVTKGLDPEAPMKDSGIEWLSRMPATWEVRRLKQLTELVTSGSRGWAEFYADEGPIFIRITNLDRKSVDLELSNVQHVNPPVGSEGERTRVRAGDVLVSITADVGTVGIVPDGLGAAYVNQHTALIRPQSSSVEPRWLALALHSGVGQRQFAALLQGGTKLGLNLDDVRNLIVPVPPLADQRRLMRHIDDAGERLGTLSATVSSALERLREHRSALITAAVTGQIDVGARKARRQAERP